MGLLTLLFQFVILLLIGLIFFLLYRNYQLKKYFEKNGFVYIGAGYNRLLRFMRGEISLPELEIILYKEAKETNQAIVGYADSFVTKGVYITDLDLAKQIYVKDFDHFVNRRKFASQRSDVLFKKMFLFLDNDEWKGRRTKLSPTFTTGKIRKMFAIFDRSCGRMSDYIRNLAQPSGKDLDVCELTSKCTMDVIASCAFGVNSKSFDYEPGQVSEFERIGKLFQLQFKPLVFLKFVVLLSAPKVADMLGFEAIDNTPQIYFKMVVEGVMKHRRETGERQDDFLQMMMDIKQGLLKSDAKEVLEIMTGEEDGRGNSSLTESEDKLGFDDEDIVANCVLFLIAGFDTLQSLLIFSLYALAVEPQVQERLRQEINACVEERKGKLSYDAVHAMQYLDMVINETLRLYTPALRTERTCTKDYKIPETNAIVEKGVLVSLPLIGLHHDEQYFENAEKFDPGRFLPERKSERHPYAFSPFGQGPRNCIGMRFALTEAKIVIASIIRDFYLEPCSKTEIPPKFGAGTTLRPKNGLWVNFKPVLEE